MVAMEGYTCRPMFNNSSVNHQLQQTKGLHALKIPDQLAWPSELNKKQFSSTLPHNSAWKGLSYLQFKGSLTLCSFHAEDLIHIRFLSNILMSDLPTRITVT